MLQYLCQCEIPGMRTFRALTSRCELAGASRLRRWGSARSRFKRTAGAQQVRSGQVYYSAKI